MLLKEMQVAFDVAKEMRVVNKDLMLLKEMRVVNKDLMLLKEMRVVNKDLMLLKEMRVVNKDLMLLKEMRVVNKDLMLGFMKTNIKKGYNCNWCRRHLFVPPHMKILKQHDSMENDDRIHLEYFLLYFLLRGIT